MTMAKREEREGGKVTASPRAARIVIVLGRAKRVDLKPLVAALTANSAADRIALLPVCSSLIDPQLRVAVRAAAADSDSPPTRIDLDEAPPTTPPMAGRINRRFQAPFSITDSVAALNRLAKVNSQLRRLTT